MALYEAIDLCSDGRVGLELLGRDAADSAELVVGVVAAPEGALLCVDVDEGVLQRICGPLHDKEEFAVGCEICGQLQFKEVGLFWLQSDCVVLL